MTDITIPPEAVKAAASAYTSVIYRGNGTTREFHDAIAAALRAGIAAWPGMHTGWQCIGCGDDAQIILPLPQEDSNAEG